MAEVPIGVCGWCIDRHDARRSIELAGVDLGLPVMQIGFFSNAAVREADAERLAAAAKTAGVQVVGVFVAFEGEDYGSIERIAASGGFMPDDAFGERSAIVNEAAAIAAGLAPVGCRSLTVHAGTVPAQTASPKYRQLVDRVRRVSDCVAGYGLRLLLETGRESADSLLAFIGALARPNIGVSFDPANFVVYGTDEAVAAVSKLRGSIDLVHIKDALRSPRPGTDFGRPAPVGVGDVQIARVVSKLRATGYRGSLLVEVSAREAGLVAIRDAVAYLRTMLG